MISGAGVSSCAVLSSGCASAESNVITTLTAPPGLLTYQWFVAARGYEMDINNTYHMDCH